MLKPTLSGYVWVFCMYLGCAVSYIAHIGTVPMYPLPPERSFFFVLFPQVIAPVGIIYVYLSLLSVFKNDLMRAVLILSLITFACNIVSSLHKNEYISFGIPHFISGWTWFIATVLLGYRTSQLLNESNKEIEAN